MPGADPEAVTVIFVAEPDGALGAADPTVRARAAAVLGQRRGRWPAGTAALLSELVARDPAPAVRRAALSALVARAVPARAAAAWEHAVSDADDHVRRSAVELAPALAARKPPVAIATRVVALLDDRAPLVAEASAFALGEIVTAGSDVETANAATFSLMRHAADHRDALVREACIAALGSLRGAHVDASEAALPAVLTAMTDKPPIRRRAVIALSAFDDPAADRAIRDALTDRDWQVRQLAEDLTPDR